MTRSDGPTIAVIGLVFGILLLLSAATTRAWAAEPDEATARRLFGEGRKLADAGRYPEACLKFEESLRLDAGVGTSFNLADCQEHTGRTASAWARFLDVAAATRLARQPERERVARARAAALEPRLARLVVAVPAPEETLVVWRDGLPVGAPTWGVPVPVDPGPHVVQAAARGKRSWSHDITVPDAPATVVVTVPALQSVSVPVAPGSLAAAAAPPSRVPPAPVGGASAKSAGGRPFAVVALGALAVAGLATGGLFALRLRTDDEDARALCPGSICADAAEKARHDGLVSDAHRDRDLAFAGAAIGAATLLVAAYLWWRPGHRPPAEASANRSRIRPVVGASEGFAWASGVSLEEAW